VEWEKEGAEALLKRLGSLEELKGLRDETVIGYDIMKDSGSVN
jgi:hypothetical protein